MANQQSMNDQLRVRRQKMQELRDEGVDPFGHRFERDFLNKELHDKFEDKTKEELIDLDVKATIAGRMVAKRGKGKVRQVECNFTFVKMKLAKKCTISLNVQI